MLISRMISVEVAAALMTVLLAVDAASLSSSDNSTISKSGPAQSPRRILPRNNETIDTTSSTVAPETHNVLKPSGNDPPEPSGSLSVAVYAAVLVTIVAMVYLVVRNFRMRYDTVRAERYGFRIRRGRRDHEVEPLARDDDDEEILFDVRGNLR